MLYFMSKSDNFTNVFKDEVKETFDASSYKAERLLLSVDNKKVIIFWLKSKMCSYKEGKRLRLLKICMMMMKMMNCFCVMVHRGKTYSLYSSRDHCQRSKPSRISDTPRAGFEPALSPSSGFDG